MGLVIIFVKQLSAYLYPASSNFKSAAVNWQFGDSNKPKDI
tara:strand:+ start:2134 stop:2256 length:123 start_codon:yes stop_codon:yes gene_type:complete